MELPGIAAVVPGTRMFGCDCRTGGESGIESGLERGFNNIENAAGTVKAMEGSGKQC
jgi:hypothetical protein